MCPGNGGGGGGGGGGKLSLSSWLFFGCVSCVTVIPNQAQKRFLKKKSRRDF